MESSTTNGNRLKSSLPTVNSFNNCGKLATISTSQESAVDSESTETFTFGSPRKYQQMQHHDIKYEGDSTFYGKLNTKASSPPEDGNYYLQ